MHRRMIWGKNENGKAIMMIDQKLPENCEKMGR
jgi:hypothetical protein